MSYFNTRNRTIEVIRRGQRGLDGDVGLVTTVTKSANHQATAGERGYAYYCTANLILSFEAAAVLTNGWHCIVDAVGGDVVLDPDGAETINGLASVTVLQGSSVLVYTDGIDLYARYFHSSGSISLLGLPTAADKIAYSTGPGVWAEADITPFARTLLDDADGAAVLTTLGVTAFAQSILDDADAAAVKATIEVILASQAEAEAGSDNTKFMTPLRVAQAIARLGLGGAAQTPQDVTSSRAFGTSYQNTTGRPIYVMFTGTRSAGTSTYGLSSDDVTWLDSINLDLDADDRDIIISMIVPPGYYYRITGTYDNSKWIEIR